jgi:hypothetical protein
MSLRRDPKVVMESLLRLKGAAQAAEGILGDRRTTWKAMECSIDCVNKSLRRTQGSESESILHPVGSFVQGIESILQEEDVKPNDPMHQTLRKLKESVASLRRPVEEGKSLRRPIEEGKSLRRPVEEGKSLRMAAKEPGKSNSLHRESLPG